MKHISVVVAAKYSAVDKDHSYLTSAKVVLMKPAVEVEQKGKKSPTAKPVSTPTKKKPVAATTPSMYRFSFLCLFASKKYQYFSIKTNPSKVQYATLSGEGVHIAAMCKCFPAIQCFSSKFCDSHEMLAGVAGEN